MAPREDPSHEHIRMGAQKRLKTSALLTVALMAVEAVGGFTSNSLALLSDAGHMLGDSIALFMSIVAIYWAMKPANTERTYGHYRAEVLATFVNGALLFYVAFQLFFEAFSRLRHPVPIRLEIMMPIALAGLVVNLISIALLHSHRSNLVTRSALFHVLSDTLSSISTVTSGVLFSWFHWTYADPVASLIIAALILRSAWHLLREAYDILMEGIPQGVDLQNVRQAILSVSGVQEVHDLHVWTIGSGFIAASAHVIVTNMNLKEAQQITMTIEAKLREQFSIEHTTLQLAPLPEPAKIQRL